MVFEGRRPGDVVDGARAAHTSRVRRWVISIKGTALLAAQLELAWSCAPESQRLYQGGAALRRTRVGANACEPLQGELRRDLRMGGDQRSVGDVFDEQLQPQPLRVLEPNTAVGTLRLDSLAREPLRPEVECLFRADTEGDAVDHPGPCTSSRHPRVFKEGHISSGAGLLVRVEEVIDGGVVLVDRLLDQPKAEYAGIKSHVARRVGSDGRDVVDAVELLHCTDENMGRHRVCSVRLSSA